MKLRFILLFLSMFTILNGQNTEPKFGKIEDSDLAMVRYDKDTTAGALMLFDYGNCNFVLSNDNSFQFEFSRHCQVKIFKKSSFSLGDMSIRIYKGVRGKESLLGLKAVTYNLVDGKQVKTKLDNDKIYKAEGKNYTDYNFAFPEIKEGSVIELSYTINSDFLYNLRGWTFQYSIPARYSQFSYSIPEYYDYRQTSKGYLTFDVSQKSTKQLMFTVTSERDSYGAFGNREPTRSSQTIHATANNTVLAVKDVPPFISEPNIDCDENYIQSLEFELSSVQFPNSMRQNYVQSWESVNTEMKTDDDFGKLLGSNGFVKDTVAALCIGKTTDLERAKSIYYNVQSRMKWNNNYRIWASNGLRKPYSDGVGSSAEINLLLVTMLRTAGLKANPVMFSTRANGVANTYFPTISKFNSVLTALEIDGMTILLDPVSKYCQFGVLPAADINGRGRVVNEVSGDWVDLIPVEKFKQNRVYNLTISPEGKFTGNIIETFDGYAGVVRRNSIISEKSLDDYFRKLQENNNGLVINKFSVENLYTINKPLTDTLNVEISDNAEMIGDKILFNPLLFEKITRNFYTLEERKYPVNYNYPVSESIVLNYELPAGYKVESMPGSALVKMPDNTIVFVYQAKYADNKLTIEFKREIYKILFLQDDYQKLKELYNQLVKKHSEQVILKKSI
jgi:hypothetical protein